MTTLLTRNDFPVNPSELFRNIENKYWFGRPKKNTAKICPYFIISDGVDLLTFDNGTMTNVGFSIDFHKRPGFFTGRFWNRGPAKFSQMVKHFIGVSFNAVAKFKDGQDHSGDIKIIDPLMAVYTLDRDRVMPLYVVVLPHSKPLQMDFIYNGSVTAMNIQDFVSDAVASHPSKYDTLSRTIAYMIGIDDIIIPKE